MEDNSPNGRKGEAEPFFPYLEYLHLEKCPNLKSWWKTPVDDDKDTTVMGATTMSFPCLSFIWIEDCPLNSMPLYPSLNEDLILVNTSSRPLRKSIQMNIILSTSSLPLSKLKHFKVKNIEEVAPDTLDECLQNLTSLESLEIASCHGLKSLFGGSQQLTSLKILNIRDCEELDLQAMHWEPLKNLSRLEISEISKCRHRPEWLQHLTNLKRLRLIDLPNLASLPEEMCCLTSLEALWINEVPQLEGRCGKNSGADWQKVAHMPRIWVNEVQLQ